MQIGRTGVQDSVVRGRTALTAHELIKVKSTTPNATNARRSPKRCRRAPAPPSSSASARSSCSGGRAGGDQMYNVMLCLGIESSCDETAAAVIEETGDPAKPWAIRSSVIASQVAIHREWGGVVPELASRQHIRDICGVLERALDEAGATWRDLGAIAVTQGPGLVGSLLVGISAAKSIALSLGVPLVPVHHLAGHIESLVPAQRRRCRCRPSCWSSPAATPASIYVPREGEYRLVGRTRDDAAGEAYDKVAKLLGLGYPGGPIVDKLAQKGNDRAIDLPIARISHRDRNAGPEGLRPAGFEDALRFRADFSFSGLKTAVMRYVKAQRELGVVTTATSAASMPAPAFANRSGRRLRQLPACRRRGAARPHVRRGRLVRSEERRHRRRRVGQQPPASGCRGARRARRHPGVRAQPRAHDRQRRDDRRGRSAPAATPASPRAWTSTPGEPPL